MRLPLRRTRFASACSTSAATESPIIGGFDAKHPAYDAVGALVRIDDDGSTRAIGFDGDAPKRVVRLSGWECVGVTSGYMTVPRVTPHYACHHEPTVCSAFGPQAQHLVDAGLACGGVTQRDGGQAVRCTRIHEGPARVIHNDCQAVQQICSSTPSEPVCAPACAADVDCEALAGECLLHEVVEENRQEYRRVLRQRYDASTRPAPLLFIPRPNITAVCSPAA